MTNNRAPQIDINSAISTIATQTYETMATPVNAGNEFCLSFLHTSLTGEEKKEKIMTTLGFLLRENKHNISRHRNMKMIRTLSTPFQGCTLQKAANRITFPWRTRVTMM